jgi:hypothetical protein
MAKIAGTAFITVDGESLSLRGNFTIRMGKERESIVGLDDYHGEKELPMAEGMDLDVTDRGDVSIRRLADMANVTIMGQLINGKTYILRNATQMKQIEVNVEDATIPLSFNGPRVEEVLAS